MKRLFFMLVISLLFFSVKAQKVDYRITTKIIHIRVIQKGSLYHYITMSFMNHSDSKIYIPDIKNMLAVDTFGGVIIVEKNNKKYIHYKDFYLNIRRNMEESLIDHNHTSSGMLIIEDYFPPPYNKKSPFYIFRVRQSAIYTKNLLIIDKQKNEYFKDSLFDQLWHNCLFLNPYEEKKNVFLVKNPYLFKDTRSKKNMNTTGNYKIFYDPMLDSSNVNKYPDKVAGYQKYVPEKIPSNVLYLKTVNDDQIKASKKKNFLKEDVPLIK